MLHALRKDTIDPYGSFSGAFVRKINKRVCWVYAGKRTTMCLKKVSNKTKTQFFDLNGSIQLTNIDRSNQPKI